MLDFMKIATRPTKHGDVEIFPKFIVCKSSDLMIRGGDFYAIWMEDRKLWSQDEQDVVALIDRELDMFAADYREKYNVNTYVQYMWDSDSGVIGKWHKYCQKDMRDNYKPLDKKLVFANQETKKNDYATRKLPYILEAGPHDAYDTLVGTLYSPEERRKIEWAIGSVVTGASKKLQKFLVIYGGPGTGKSTIIDIICMLFDGYYGVFNAKALGSASDNFALEAFKQNPMVAIQQDADLSHIEDNTRLNSVISHDPITINEKHKSLYQMKIEALLILGSNKPVKITDSKSGLIRRLIDVNPTGQKLPPAVYNQLMEQIVFELGHIAQHCKEIFEEDPLYYNDYMPVKMMGETNDFFNFVEEYYDVFKRDDQTTLKEAWEMYKTFVDKAKIQYPYAMRAVKIELKTYFDNYEEDCQDPDTKQHIRNLYSGFRYKIFDNNGVRAEEHRTVKVKVKDKPPIEFIEQPSNLDIFCADCPAQYATSAETPGKKWENVTTPLRNLVTSRLHYVKVPENLIVIDFDLKDESGRKSFEKNLEAASKWPKTYAELSKSGSGIHLHYIYDGDVNLLSRVYDDSIEIKVFTGNSSLRRKVTKCNAEPIQHIASGLPLKGNAEKLENVDIIKNEKILRTMIKRNLNKEYHPATKPSVDFIKHLLDQAYASGMKYDVSDLFDSVLAFAACSTHQSENCLALVHMMHFKSDEASLSVSSEAPIIFLDVEVFPNLFLVNWKFRGKNNKCVRMINPSSRDIEELFNYRIIGFNNREYDNHMLYARYLGYDNMRLFKLSQDIIVKQNKRAKFSEAFNISYTDIYDYMSAANKMSLKKWEIKLGIIHMELGLPWDKPVPQELWPTVAEYCDNDVISTEAVFDATQDDFIAREILAKLADMTVNDTTNSLTAKIIFGNVKNPVLNYVDLSQEFPGYEFIKKYNALTGKYDRINMYRGIDLGLGGYVYAEPGMYKDVALIDVASMHPSSIIALRALGEYTDCYENLVKVRKLIKHKKLDEAKKMFDGKLEEFLTDSKSAKKLSTALKTAINAVYGLTSAQFDNIFKDPRNENNIVALRGALFMKTLQDAVKAKGFTVVHIKTDSIKIANATPEIINFCMDFAKSYGYEFEHEATYDRICLVNDAVYIARYAYEDKIVNKLHYEAPEENKEEGGKWTATGTQFQVPYVFKKCFTKEPIVFDDVCEIKQVKTAMYLDFNEELCQDKQYKIYDKVLKLRHINDDLDPEKDKLHVFKNPELKLLETYQNQSDAEIIEYMERFHDRRFVGKVGYFCPIKPGYGAAELVRESVKKGGLIGYDSVTGTSGYRWLEVANVKGKCEDLIDYGYHNTLVDKAIEAISMYGDYEWFISDDNLH